MIITPAKFEDRIKDILTNRQLNHGREIMFLMFDTLESLGYGSGIKVLKEVHKWNDRQRTTDQ